MTTVPVKNKLDAPHIGEASSLYPLISAKIRLAEFTESKTENVSEPLWSADWWGLDRSVLFCGLSRACQHDVLMACNRTVLNEAYFIEKSGLAYSAKMMLLAPSTDVAQLYALIGADEAKHLAWLEPYVVNEDKTRPYGQFLAFLSSLIEDAPPHLLVYLVQIILEGWGLDHYKKLAEGCQDSILASRLSAIVKDEALHHKSGHLLFDAKSLTKEDAAFTRKALIAYADMVRVGPWSVLEAVEQTVGADLSKAQLEALLLALNHPAESTRKLGLLKTLMGQPGVEPLVNELEAAGYFLPLAPEAVATMYLAARQ